MTKSIVVLLHRSVRDLLSDPWQVSLMTWLPVLLSLMLWGVFARSLPTQLPVAWTDLDNTSVSRALGRKLQASAAIGLVAYATEAEAERAMRRGEVYAQVVIPARFAADLSSGRRPQLPVYYNGQFLLMGKRLYSAAASALRGGLAELGALGAMAEGVPAKALPVVMAPVTVSMTPMFNPDLGYLPFLLPGLLLALYQLLVSATLVNAVARGKRGLPLRILLLLLWWWLMGGIGLLVLYSGLGLPMAGSVMVLWLATIPLLGAIAGIILSVAMVVDDPVRATSIGGALFAPAFAYMGISFPLESMPALAQLWRVLMPSTHYLPLMLQAGANHNWSATWPLLLISLLLVPVACLYRRMS
ncbi:ABC transporter permease [Ferrimonas sediminicola]|uniref:ABC transporter permease n=1 Tax=Ferrimonas sediminicola TaxID=2569538 RepID=A0A4U1BJ86_9GAMM|nr:ABC transporter permease [Ferrimonas sediminicola]TKB51225.1 ABC transporter permease [Ferrimonas sediminicola]